MPLGNLTSQFFANLYLHELDYFVKHVLKIKYYIRYVDDFVIFYHSKKQLKIWKKEIENFLRDKLKIELHPQKSKILFLNNGVNFLGFKIFYYYRILRKSNVQNFEKRFNQMKIWFEQHFITRERAFESLEGWLAYASHANTYKYRKHIIKLFSKLFPFRNERVSNWKKHNNFIKKIKESEIQFSVQKTLFLLNKGLRVKEIADKRKIKESTVWEHLANLIKHKQVSVSNILSYSKIKKILFKIYSKKDRLKDIKRRLNDDSISYDEINCVLASVKA